MLTALRTDPQGDDITSAHKHTLVSLALLALSLIISGCSSLPKEVERTPSYVITDTASTRLAGEVSPLLDANPGQSGFHLLYDGAEAYAMRLRLIRQAEKSVDAQYYIWHADLTGNSMYAELLRAADRGVRVRILLDDLDTAGKDKWLQLMDTHPQIQVRVYNPFVHRDLRGLDFVTDTKRVDHRMHTKTLTADNQVTIFGGRNIGDEYFAAATDVGFGDMDVMALGPIAGEVSSQFDLFWNSEWVYPITAFDPDKLINVSDIEAFRVAAEKYLREAQQSDYAAVLRELDQGSYNFADLDLAWSNWFLAYDSPDNLVKEELDPETSLAPRLKQGMDAAQQELDIVSPYFVPGEDFTKYLTDRVAGGVRVRILTNSLSANDVGLVHAGYMRYREDLIAGGVELYEFKSTRNRELEKAQGRNKINAERASLHAKFMGFDRRFLFIGSFNLDARSAVLNTELGAYFADPVYAQRMAELFDRQILQVAYHVRLDGDGELEWFTIDPNGQEVRLDQEPDTTFWQRFNTRVLSPIVPESEL
jgi:putative cardiolipin synthase